MDVIPVPGLSKQYLKYLCLRHLQREIFFYDTLGCSRITLKALTIEAMVTQILQVAKKNYLTSFGLITTFF